ncbi:MAG TPA: zinc-ribbon domain-containing protein, partial [Thermoplasmata archaeon]|nr:zinc-ribbon domain-containing protein [Thermoplasmata archaeon]
MIYCTKCGTQLPDDARFCAKCGTATAAGGAGGAAAAPAAAPRQGAPTLAPAGVQELKCPTCGAPIKP